MPRAAQPDSSRAHNRRADGIIAELVSHEKNFQIVLLQKAFHKKRRERLVSGLSRYFPFHYGPANQRPRTRDKNSGLLILSKIPLKNCREHDFQVKAKGVEGLVPKGGMLLEGRIKRKSFQILNSHFQGHVNLVKKSTIRRIRIQQAEELVRYLLNPRRREGITQIVGGDLCMDHRTDPGYSELIKAFDVPDFSITHGEYRMTSYPRPKNDIGRTFVKEPSLKDYVFVRNGAPSLERGIIRKVFRFRHPWKSSAHSQDKSDLSYRFALGAAIPIDRLG